MERFCYPQGLILGVIRYLRMDQVKPSVLEANIVKTVAWFSLFDYPLTAFDIWKWLGVKSSFHEVEETLRTSLWLRGRLEAKEGLFVLGGRSAEGIIATHQERFLDAARKFKKLGLAARYFSFFPFVRAVFACNTLAWHHTAPESDIDLFIVVSPGTIWLTRLLLVTPFRLLGRRPRQTTVDPFCFSFFVTDENLSLKDLLLSEGDPYMAYWLASLIPVFDREGIQNQLNEKNKWAFELLPNILPVTTNKNSKSFKILFFLKFFEKYSKRFQQKFLPEPIKNAANLDSRVVVSDTVLKFHINDRRAHFRDEWKKIYEAYGAN